MSKNKTKACNLAKQELQMVKAMSCSQFQPIYTVVVWSLGHLIAFLNSALISVNQDKTKYISIPNLLVRIVTLFESPMSAEVENASIRSLERLHYL